MCHTTHPNLNINDDNTQEILPMKRLHHEEPFTYVGYTTTPDGQTASSEKKMTAICQSFVQKLRKSSMKPNDYSIALHNIFYPKLRYQLAAYAIPYKQFTTIKKIYEPDIIAKMGYNRPWPNVLKYGTHHIGSLNLPDLHLEQTILQIQTVLFLIKTNEYTSLINSTLDLYQLQSGRRENTLKTPLPLRYTNSTWLKEMIYAMHRYKISIIILNSLTFPP